MQEVDALINTQQDAVSYRSIYLPHNHVYKQCYTERYSQTDYPRLSVHFKKLLTYPKEKMVVCPVVPGLDSNFNWCHSQNLVVSVALSLSHSYQSSLSVHHIIKESSLLKLFFV